MALERQGSNWTRRWDQKATFVRQWSVNNDAKQCN